jgi:carbon storage regulator
MRRGLRGCVINQYTIGKHGGYAMLVLSRRENQRIQLGNSIVLTVVRVSGDRVRLGIEAPADVRVLRGELEPHIVQSPALPKAG